MRYRTFMGRIVAALSMFAMCAWCYGQSWPEERGLIFTIVNRYTWRVQVQLRHLPMYPGYENFSGTVPGVNFSNPNTRFLSVDVDYRTKSIYMYEYHLRSIFTGTGYSKNLSISDMKFKQMHLGVSRGNIQVAVDWLSHTVYWSDSAFRWIVAAPGQRDMIDKDYYKVIADTHLDAPDGLTVDPLEGYLFWSDNGKHPKIERSDLKGGNRHTIFSKHLESPLTLEADTFEKRIYWIDSHLESIVSSTYDGEDVISIHRIPNSNLFDLAIFREVIYISDIRNGNVYTLNKTKGIHMGKQESTVIRIWPETIYGIAVYGEEKQPLKDKDYCAELNCEHLCISTKDGAECICSEGYQRNESTGKCQEMTGGSLKAIVVANKTHICLTDIRSFAKAAYQYVCKFTVYKQYTDTSTPSPARRKKRQAFTSPAPATTSTTTRVKNSSTAWPPIFSSTMSTGSTHTISTSSTTARPTSTPVTGSLHNISTLSPHSKSTARQTSIPTTGSAHSFSTSMPHSKTTTRPTSPSSTIAETTVPPTEEPVAFIKMFDMDMENRIFFFATENNTIYKRAIDLPIENNDKETVAETSGTISGLAYDAEDGDNLYWCESNTGFIRVVNVRTKAVKIVSLFNNRLSNPKDLIVLLEHRLLAMLTGTGSDMSIKTVTMEGSDVKQITRGRQKISSFTFDREQNLFCYIVGRYLYRTSLDMADTDIIYYAVDNDAYNIVLYQNYFVWVHRDKTAGEHFVSSLDITTRREVRDGPLGNTSVDIVDMKVLDRSLQTTNITSPCAYEDGGCSQICITKYINDTMTPVCECRLGYTLDIEDNRTCDSTVVEDNFILAADSTNNVLLQINLENGQINAIPNPDNDDYKGVFFDIETKTIIWSENYDRNIYTSNLNGTEGRLLANLGYSGYPYRFDKDMTTGNLYFTSYYNSFIGVVTPSGDHFLLNRIFTWSQLGDIVLHPAKGFMYYTVNNYISQYVGRSDMDGKNSVQLIEGKHVGKPDGLAIDFINDHLYWSDSKYDTIQRCNLDGDDCVTIVNMTGTYRYEEIKDLVTDGEYLYYSAYRKDHVVRVELKPDYTRTIVGQSPGVGMLDTIAFYSSKNKNIQPISTACKARNGRGDCSTICFPTQVGRSCACEPGVALKGDGRTCANVYQCTDLINQPVTLIGGTEDFADVTFSSSCLRHLHDECKYKCPANFVPLFDTVLTCTNVGWDLEFETLCQELRCPVFIDNGQLDSNCTREVGRTCEYKCNEGYMKTTEIIVCTNNGTYQAPQSELCALVKCPSTISNGKITGVCNQTVGVACDFKCNVGFRAIDPSDKTTCKSNGQWDVADNVCTEITCPATVENGKISSDCSRKIGEKCDYGCAVDFVPTREKVVCTGNGTYHTPKNGLCTPYKCSDMIKNGKLDKDCTRVLGESCVYTCNKYFTPSAMDRRTVCQSDGWSQASTDLCIESVCTNTSLTNGNIIGKCSSKVGDNCMFQCDPGFVNTTKETVCLDDLIWHPKDACTAYKCSNKIENGTLVDGCSRTIGSTCQFNCDKYFKPTAPTKSITCQSTGWNPVSTTLCKESVCGDKTLLNGKITGNCKRKIGESCTFQCNSGYVNTTDDVVCQDDNTWHPTQACTAYMCSGKIENGQLDPGCARTVGISCKYRCNKYYSPSITDNIAITCQADGWSRPSTGLCKVSVCEDSSLSNGKIIGMCSKTIGEVCDFQCDKGYMNTTNMAVCKSDKMWHPRESCEVVKCPATVPNGEITGACDFSIGAICTFKCNENFISNGLYSSITCKSNRQWDAFEDLCLVSECKDTSLSNGRVSGDCRKMVGETCSLECDYGYINTTPVAVCKSDYMWHPTESCTAIQCSPYIPNGKIIGPCDLAMGTTCNFSCYDDFKASDLQTNTTCNTSGQWDITNSLCLERISVATSKPKFYGLPVTGVATGIAILLLAVIVLIGAVIFLFLRRRSNSLLSHKVKTPFRHGRNTAFENPGYIQNIEPPVQTTDVDEAQLQPMSFSEGAGSSDDGVIHAVNDNEPLPDVAQIDITNDTAVLTHDSWQKEKENFDFDKY